MKNKPQKLSEKINKLQVKLNIFLGGGNKISLI